MFRFRVDFAGHKGPVPYKAITKQPGAYFNLDVNNTTVKTSIPFLVQGDLKTVEPAVTVALATCLNKGCQKNSSNPLTFLPPPSTSGQAQDDVSAGAGAAEVPEDIRSPTHLSTSGQALTDAGAGAGAGAAEVPEGTRPPTLQDPVPEAPEGAQSAGACDTSQSKSTKSRKGAKAKRQPTPTPQEPCQGVAKAAANPATHQGPPSMPSTANLASNALLTPDSPALEKNQKRKRAEGNAEASTEPKRTRQRVGKALPVTEPPVSSGTAPAEPVPKQKSGTRSSACTKKSKSK